MLWSFSPAAHAMLVRFTKMHGIGNDFMMLDLITQAVQLRPEQISRWADRRTGIGFDQLLTIEPPTDPDKDFFYRIYNADGSHAEQCGNGARCLMRFARDRGLTNKSVIWVQTIKGSMEIRLEPDGNITVDMGQPVLEPSAIPFLAEAEAVTYRLRTCGQAGDVPQEVQFAAVSMGNPHAVIQVPSVETAPVAALGPLVQRHPSFPRQVNVGFMEVVDRARIRLRVFERGAGETLACGSGACAAVVAGRLQGLLDERVQVELPGGKLSVNWAGKGAPVLMTGPVCRVYEGRFQL